MCDFQQPGNSEFTATRWAPGTSRCALAGGCPSEGPVLPPRSVPCVPAGKAAASWAALPSAQPGLSTQGLFLILAAFLRDVFILQGPVMSSATFTSLWVNGASVEELRWLPGSRLVSKHAAQCWLFSRPCPACKLQPFGQVTNGAAGMQEAL